jgi:plastocyanin
MNSFKFARTVAALLCVLVTAAASLLHAQTVTVTGKVVRPAQRDAKSDATNKVVWLVPLDADAVQNNAQPAHRAQLVQKDKTFEPHLLVIPAGTLVDFPNRDAFFHNVFSLFNGKRFDLGLYEAGSSRAVRFDRPGVSYIFCNIHPQMSAVVIALATPYYAIADRAGEVAIKNVPAGRYRLGLWAEGASSDALDKLSREITIGESAASLGVLNLPENRLAASHKNKYGRDYEPAPAGTAYDPRE